MSKYTLYLFICSILLFACSGPKNAYKTQPVEEEAVKKVVVALFDAMRTSDSTKAKTLFLPNAQAYTIANKADESRLVPGNIEGFIQAIGTAKEVIWDERIQNLSIKVDGTMATAWMDYAFYLGDKFSHCGVNHMVFHKKAGQWKIFFLSDTRRKDNCNFKS